MKNLFKSLMLVAVAAMAFTACQNDVDNVNAVSKGLTLTFSGSFAEDTRVAFGDYDGDAYKVVWSGDEAENTTFTAFDADGGQYGSQSVAMEVVENSTKAIFTVEWYDASYFADCDIIAYVGNGVSKYTGNFNFDDSTVQCPTDNSVDTNYFGLKGTFPYKAGEATVIDGVFEHLTAYGKVTLPEVEGVKFDSVKVVLTGASEDVVKTYNLDVTNVTTQTYFFACEPMAEVTKFSVSASNASGDMYAYETEVLNGLSFNAGRVSNIKVKELNKLEASYSMTGYVSNNYGYSELMLFVNDDRTGDKVATFAVDYDPNITLIPAGTYQFTSADDTYNNEYFVGGFMYWYGDCYPEPSYPVNLYDKIGMEVEHLAKGYDITITWELDGVVGTYSYAGIIEHAYPDFVDWGYYMYNPGDVFPLATPEVSASANGNAITLSWGAVENAASYTIFKSVEVGYEREYVELATVNSDVLTYTITDLEFNTEYTFGVQANVAQGDTNYKNSNIAGVTQKTTFDFNNPDYAIVFTDCVVDGNVYQFSNNNGDKWTLTLINPLAAGTFVQSNWSNAYWSGNDTTINIAIAKQWYDGYIYNGTLEVTANGDEYTIVMKASAGISGDNVVGGNGEKSLKLSYTGKLGGSNEPEDDDTSVTLTSAVATPSASSFIGGTGYDLNFTDADGNTIFYRVQTKGHTYLREGDWNGNYGWAVEGFIDAVTWPGVGQPWPYTMTVAVVDEAYDITLQVADYKNDGKLYTAHYAGQITNFTLPVAEGGDDLPEFVIPGEGLSYIYDYRYTTLVDGLDDSNSIRVAQDNGWVWDIKFNSDLASIVPGDYEAVHYFTAADALEVDTYNGGFQIAQYSYIYPDEYEKVTTFNVQKEGDIYCITMIGSGGDGANGASYRCVYIGKIENN